ncbi:hypothetical protein E6W36_07675 [Hankyongella ginsenosidimutans]|uniref:Uncharacterized protein n=1 Tax=Hankyongella ginsenosidimutans TaxID=1763828 RepID=A0A4D7C9C2_9SPHN|nr:hypothetical protein [Hankyongella ginsenosidimutans]QCI79467.1 hypothetical protein E6W36_07675 [Hankyongella ginsenosidimutans]
MFRRNAMSSVVLLLYACAGAPQPPVDPRLHAVAGSGADAPWPSLLTPEERAATDRLNAQMTATDAAADMKAMIPDLRRSSGEADLLEKDLESAMIRWTRQGAALEEALDAAASNPSSATRTKAQIELSRLNNAASRFDTLHSNAERLAGDLAMLSVNGHPVAGPLREAGAALKMIEDAQAAHRIAVGAATRRLAELGGS